MNLYKYVYIHINKFRIKLCIKTKFCCISNLTKISDFYFVMLVASKLLLLYFEFPTQSAEEQYETYDHPILKHTRLIDFLERVLIK